jgi:hypothetical protein
MTISPRNKPLRDSNCSSYSKNENDETELRLDEKSEED